MRRFGRRTGFIAAAVLAALAAAGAAYAILAREFFLFCGAVLLIGVNSAFVQQYRFAAAESMPSLAGRAVSSVLLGGIAAGILGPEIGKRAKDLLAGAEYAGSFASLIVLYLGVAVLLSRLSGIRETVETTGGEERPVRQVLAQPAVRVAILAGIVSFGVMSFIMTATPLSMHRMDGHSVPSTGTVIQSHVIAMYLPSLFTSSLISWLGIKKLMGMGVGAMTGCVFLTLLGHGLPHYWVALVLLGFGWNFLFVGGTLLLTQSYRPAERFKIQAVNDFLIFGIQALASLSAGSVLFSLGWNRLVALTLPALLGVAIALSLLRQVPSRAPVQASQAAD
jgi:MFS family permease